MKPATLLASSMALVAPALGRISGIAVPATIAPSSSFRVIIETENFIQSVQDVAISFGFSPAGSFNNESLGTFLSSRYLGPDESNITNNITHIVDIPASAPEGPAVFSGALFSLLGAIFSPNIEDFTVNVTIGTSTDLGSYISSSG